MAKGLLITAFLAALAAAGYWGWNRHLARMPSVVAESEADRSAAVRSAFTNNGEAGIEVDAVLAAELDNFFRKLSRAFRDSDGDEIDALWSTSAMLNFVKRSGVIGWDRFDHKKRRAIEKTLGAQFGALLVQQAASFRFEEDFRIVRVERIKEGELVVYLRTYDTAFDTRGKSRWWLLRDGDGNWRTYDNEDLETGLRFSLMLSVGLTAALEGSAAWAPDLMTLFETLQQWWGDADPSDDPEEISNAKRAAEKVLSLHPPEAIESVTRIMLTALLTWEEDHEALLEELDRIERLSGPVPIVHYQRGTSYAAMERYPEALEAYERYVAMLGWDAEIHELVADCHHAMGDLGKAAEHARAGLADDPKATGCLATLAVSLPAAALGEFDEHLAKLPADELESAYETVLDYALMIEEQDVFEAVFDKFQKALPESELNEYYLEELAELKKGDAAGD